MFVIWKRERLFVFNDLYPFICWGGAGNLNLKGCGRKAALGTADVDLSAPDAERIVGMAMLKPKF